MTARLRAQYDEMVNVPVRAYDLGDEPAKPDDEKVEIKSDAAAQAEIKTSNQVMKERYIRAFEEKRRRLNQMLISEF